MEDVVDKEVFRWSGEVEQRGLYAYTECGLSNIFLVNGYNTIVLEDEEFVSVQDVDGLHRAICRHLVLHRKALSGNEIKFIRKTMDLTQKELAEKLGNDSQTVARWEKGACAIPGPSEKLLRVVLLAHTASTPEDQDLLRKMINSILSALDELDDHPADQAQFELHEQWAEAA